MEPKVKGWCPGAYKPMMSGDGLVVRVRPRLARLTREQVLGLCDASLSHGSGIIDLTSRSNLQIRGVARDGHEALIADLNSLDLLDHDPRLEQRRNILISPFYADGDDTVQIAGDLTNRLSDLPKIPAKFGFAVDTGEAPLLTRDSADIRIERSKSGLIIRADGWGLGMPVAVNEAVDQIIRLTEWFMDNAGGIKRMAKLLETTPLPEWAKGTQMPLQTGDRPEPGINPLGRAFGVAFGQIGASELKQLIVASNATAMRTTPWRLFILEGASDTDTDFITQPDSPLLRVDACPGAPMCNVATVETRALAARLAPQVTGRLHISGCSKGCARNRAADITLTGRNGRFDLVQDGRACDTPAITGLTPDQILTRFGAN